MAPRGAAEPDPGKRTDSLLSRYATLILITGLVVALGLRLALSTGGGNQWDLDVYKAWTKTVAERGAVHAYDGPVTVDYPPVFLYWLDLGGRAYRALISPELDLDRPEMTLLIRLPGLVLDLVLGVMIYEFVRRRAGATWGLTASFAYLFNPGVVFSLAYWGMPDSPHAVLIIASLWLALRGKPFLAWAVISVGVFTKPQADIYAPLVALITLRDGGLRACLRGSLGILAGVLVAIGPFLVAGTVGGVFEQFLKAADYDPFISNNAHNVWWLIGWGYGLQIRDTEPFLGPLSYRVVAVLVLLGFYLFSLFQVWRRRDETSTLEISAYVGLILFMLMTVVHENHSYAVLPILALIWWRNPTLGWLYLAVSVVFLANLVLHDSTIYERLQAVGLHYRHIAATLVNATLYLAIFVWWTLRIAGRRSLLSEPGDRPPLGGGLLVRASLLTAVVVAVFLVSPQVVRPSADLTVIGRPSGAEFDGKIRLLGYQVQPGRVRPGESVRFSFTWQAMQDLDDHYMLFVHLLDQEFKPGGQVDGPPTRNLYPTRFWRKGEVIQDERTVPVRSDAVPGVYQIEIGFYPLTDFKRLPVVVDGRRDSKVNLGRVVVPVANQIPAGSRIDADFGDVARLVMTQSHDNGLILIWFARARTDIDYTVFVQLIGPDGRPAAQYDGQPVGGRYPTSAWEPGDVVIDPTRFIVPTNLPPGEYRIIAGLYDVKTGRRLSAGATDHVTLGVVRR